jgi:hypothetical protein
LVAPNGFGKSSFATAFKLLKKSKIELHKNDFHQENDDLLPSIEISYLDDEGNLQVVRASDTTNGIDSAFDCFVINNQVFAKAKKNRIGGHVIASALLETPPIVLFSTIPEKSTFNYSVTGHRTSIGKNGKTFPNISSIY